MTQCWEPGTQYNRGDVVEYEGHRYKIIQAHFSQGDWTPPVTPALWGRESDNDHNSGGENQHHQGGYQQQQQQQQPYQPPQQQQPPQYNQDNNDQSDDKKHWYDEKDVQKEMEVGGGLLGGAALLAGGLFAYKKMQEKHGDEKAQDWARDNWLNEARERTDSFHRQGSNEAAVWVLTKGKTIPRGAICVGQEQSWSLYIGRAFIDGGIQLGKASDAFKQGCVIGYGHKEIHVDEYEVLVGDMNRLRWVPASGHLNLGNLGYRPVIGGREKSGTPLYVAEAPHNGAVHPGKVGESLEGAFIPYDGKEVLVKEYRVLCYNN